MMKSVQRPSSSPRKKRLFRGGFTMVELVVGLVLLATLLVSMLMVLSRQRRANQIASARQQAVQAADQLLAGWFNSQAGMPLAGQGQILGTQMVWRTQVARNVLVFEQPVPVVRMSIFLRGTSTLNGRVGADRVNGRDQMDSELLAIELLAPQGGR
ncbi:MAG: hypothetical protein AAGG44_05325 [Planctomycetota bacterium]